MVIYTDSDHDDVMPLSGATLDFEFGAGTDNDFTCQIALEDHCCDNKSFIYVEDVDSSGNVIFTEIGGIVYTIKPDTSSGTITYSGPTWHGLLENHIIEPPDGEDYRTVSGDANTVLSSLISLMGIGDLFIASSEASGFTLSNYQIDRYIGGYTAITKMLLSVGAKLQLYFDGYHVNLSAVPLIDYSDDEEWDDDQYTFTITKSCRFLNHVICAGSGDLKERKIIHMYQDESGNVSKTQTYTGVDEICQLYDYPNAESDDALEAGGIKLLNDAYAAANSVSQKFSESGLYDIGDTVGATEKYTGIKVKETIASKVVKISGDTTEITCKVGE